MSQANAGPRFTRSGDVYFEPGHKIAGKYVVESVLGEGATSVVYVARRDTPQSVQRPSPAAHEMLDEDSSPPEQPSLVALKVIHKNLCEDPQIVGRFQREAAILKRLEGPHVLRVYETLEEDGLLVLVLEYVPSTPLDQRLAHDTRMSVSTAIEIVLQVCAGLGTAHAAGVVHRDLKPANVLYSTDSESDRVFVKVADFGLAKLVHGDKMVTGLTEHDMIFGTPEYMAPEQARGEDVDARADLYAAGCMLYEMLTGDVPFHGRSPMVTMTAHLLEEVPPIRSRRTDGAISPALEAVVLRVLSKSPADRYPSARALAEALLAAESNRVVAKTAAATASTDALGDTDLNVDVTAAEKLASSAVSLVSTTLTHSPTLPGEPPIGEKGADPASPVDPAAIPPPSDTVPLGAIPLTSRGSSPWLWVAVAVVAALAAIAIGVAAGTH